jgi:hypothetical protein
MSQSPPPGFPPPLPPLPAAPLYGVPSPPANGFAIASLVLGIISLACTNCMTAIPAIIFGHVALWQIGQPGAQTGGRGMAIAGLVLGYLAVALSLCIGIVYLMFILMAFAGGGGNMHFHMH